MYPAFSFTIVFIFSISRYQNLLLFQEPSEPDSLESEFHNYQLLCDEDISQNVWKEAKSNSGNIQIDRIWFFVSEMKNVDGSYQLEKLSRLILTVPHSNAEEESIFSMTSENKTYFYPNLNSDKTLRSLITVKLATENKPIHKIKLPQGVFDEAKEGH